MGLYPILLNLEGRRVTVIGGGDVALRKVRDLLEAGAVVRVVAPEVHAELIALADDRSDRLSLEKRGYLEGDLEGTTLVFSATSSVEVNKRVFREAEARGIFINAVDDPPNCSFIVPSMLRRGELIVAVSTGGASPALAARLRRSLEKALPENIETVLDALRAARSLLQKDPAFEAFDTMKRGALLKKITSDDALLDGIASSYMGGRLKEFLLSMMG
jgi:precorrin-2 dehydrogenase / sirohydrochlorin ferrochelatase